MNITQKIIHHLLRGGFHRAILLPDVESGKPDAFAYIGAVRDTGRYEIIRVTFSGQNDDPWGSYGVDTDDVIRGVFNSEEWSGVWTTEEDEQLTPYGNMNAMDNCDDDECYYHIDHDTIAVNVAGLIIETEEGGYDVNSNVIVYTTG